MTTGSPPPPPPPPFAPPPRRASTLHQIGVIGLGIVFAVFLLFILSDCDRHVSAFRAGYGGPEEMEEHRRKYPPR